MSDEQHRIPDPPPITERMTTGSHGTGAVALIGTVVCAYDIPDSDRDETLLRFDDGRVICVSTDPGYKDPDGLIRDDTRWEVVLYNATDTEAGKAMQNLAPGHWL